MKLSKLNESNEFVILPWFLISLTVVALIFFVNAISHSEGQEQEIEDKESTYHILEVVDDNPLLHYLIVYDKDTKVMYTMSYANNSSGIATVMVDEGGNPKLYED